MTGSNYHVIQIGHSGSGGALGIAVADRVLMQENTYYTVITPENCSTILYKDREEEHVIKTANALRLTAEDLKSFRIIDEIVAIGSGKRQGEISYGGTK